MPPHSLEQLFLTKMFESVTTLGPNCLPSRELGQDGLIGRSVCDKIVFERLYCFGSYVAAVDANGEPQGEIRRN